MLQMHLLYSISQPAGMTEEAKFRKQHVRLFDVVVGLSPSLRPGTDAYDRPLSIGFESVLVEGDTAEWKSHQVKRLLNICIRRWGYDGISLE